MERWFAFRLAAPAFREKHHTNLDNEIGAAQLCGAILVAAPSSLPALFLSGQRARQTIGDIPAAIIGVVGYLLAGRTGATRPRAIAYGMCFLFIWRHLGTRQKPICRSLGEDTDAKSAAPWAMAESEVPQEGHPLQD